MGPEEKRTRLHPKRACCRPRAFCVLSAVLGFRVYGLAPAMFTISPNGFDMGYVGVILG